MCGCNVNCGCNCCNGNCGCSGGCKNCGCQGYCVGDVCYGYGSNSHATESKMTINLVVQDKSSSCGCNKKSKCSRCSCEK